MALWSETRCPAIDTVGRWRSGVDEAQGTLDAHPGAVAQCRCGGHMDRLVLVAIATPRMDGA